MTDITANTGFAIDKGEVVFHTRYGSTIRHGGSPVGILLDASAGFIKAGTVADLHDRRSLQIAGARQMAPSLSDDLARDLVILKVEPTKDSIDRANMVLHHQYVAQQVAEGLREGVTPEIAEPIPA